MSEPAPNNSRPVSIRNSRAIPILAGGVIVITFAFVATPFQLDIAAQIFLAAIGALSLMLLTGFAGLISLGHAGLIAAGAFTAGILSKELGASIFLTIPAAAVTGAMLGFIFGLPSLRLRGLYLAVSTLALHFVVVYFGNEYEHQRGLSAGIIIDAPTIFGWQLTGERTWYFVLLGFVILVWWMCSNILATRTGRSWRALRTSETVTEALGINVARAKLSAFVISSAITAVGGALFAHYRGFVSVEAFSLYLSIQYVAMVIIGGFGSLLGAVLGAAFVTLLPYLIEDAVMLLPGASRYAGAVFAVNYAAFGLIMIVFLIFEPAGLIGAWKRLRRRMAALFVSRSKVSGAAE